MHPGIEANGHFGHLQDRVPGLADDLRTGLHPASYEARPRTNDSRGGQPSQEAPQIVWQAPWRALQAPQTRRTAPGSDSPSGRVERAVIAMLRQRLYGILADYPDCNDHTTLRNDPIFKLIADRQPNDGALASQPTLSRFENRVEVRALVGLNDWLTTTGIERLRRKHGGRVRANRQSTTPNPKNRLTHPNMTHHVNVVNNVG